MTLIHSLPPPKKSNARGVTNGLGMSSSQKPPDPQLFQNANSAGAVKSPHSLHHQKKKEKKIPPQTLEHALLQEKRTFYIFLERKSRTDPSAPNCGSVSSPPESGPPTPSPHPTLRPPVPGPTRACLRLARGRLQRPEGEGGPVARRLRAEARARAFLCAPGTCRIGSAGAAVGVGGASRATR